MMDMLRNKSDADQVANLESTSAQVNITTNTTATNTTAAI